MTHPNGRYHVERLLRGGWVLSDAFETYEAADDWARTLMVCDRYLVGGGGVRVVDMERERREADAVVWSVLG